jgi:hypothetical protein
VDDFLITKFVNGNDKNRMGYKKKCLGIFFFFLKVPGIAVEDRITGGGTPHDLS